MAILHELVATADVVQHNMRYDAAVRLGRRLREPAGDQARPRVLPHARLRARRRGRGCPATTRPVPRWPDPTGSTAASITTASRSGRWCRWATPATASSPPSAWCRRSTTGTAPGKASSSTRRSCTRSCSTRRSRGAWPTAAGTVTVRASTPCSSVTTPRNASTRPPTAGCASPRPPTSSAARCASVLGVDKVGDGTAFGALEPVFRTRSAAQWFGEPRRRRGAQRGVEPRLRPRSLRRSRDDRQGMGHEVPPPDRRRHGAVRTALRLRRDPRRRAGTAARARSGHARILHELGYDDTRIDELAEAKAILDWRP